GRGARLDDGVGGAAAEGHRDLALEVLLPALAGLRRNRPQGWRGVVLDLDARFGCQWRPGLVAPPSGACAGGHEKSYGKRNEHGENTPPMTPDLHCLSLTLDSRTRIAGLGGNRQ